MYAYSNILAALLLRGRTGRGCRIDVSMLESMVEWMSYPLYYASEGASPPPRTGVTHATICPYGPFAAGDGKVVILGVQNEREWAAFCEQVLLQSALAREPRFASNAERVAHRDELQAIIATAFAPLTVRELADRLDAAKIANARMNDMQEVWSHPQLAARNRWVSVGSAAGAIPALLPPGLPGAFAPRMDAVPGLGEHTDAILGELGYASAEIAALRSARAI